MDIVDDALDRLAAAPIDARLAANEAEWLAGMAAAGRPRRDAGMVGSSVLAAVIALAVGFVGAELPSAPADPRPALSPFGPAVPLAPSTLLAEG